MVVEKVAQLIAQYKGVEASSVSAESSLESLKLDSLDTVQIIMDLETEFNVTLEMENQVKTVGELAALIEAKLA